MDTRRLSTNLPPYLLLIVVVTLTWCAVYGRWTLIAWNTPIAYHGDSMVEMAFAKGLATGDVKPILPKYPAGLGAPFVANWNDYPTIEEPIYAWQALLVRIFGLFAGSNLAVLSAHILAAISFCAVSRVLGYSRIWSLVGGILFGLTPYAFSRSLPHINLTFYWHIPWGLLVAWWCASAVALTPRRIAISLVVAAGFGAQSIYYANMFGQLLMGTVLVSLLRRQGWRRIVFPIVLCLIVVLTLLVMNIDTLYERMVSGPNPLAVVRNYAGLEIYALRPIELLLPATHRLTALEAWAGRAYYAQTMLHGETGSPYLGIIGLITGFWLALTICQNMLRGHTAIIWNFWGIMWISLFSVVGGVNGVVGAFGLVLFRCTNRAFIYILALLLLFAVRELSRLTRFWPFAATSVLAALVTIVGLLDQTPPSVNSAYTQAVRAQTVVDRTFVQALESRLSPGAMVFELPVMQFPESAPINGMQDYEHFRPYLYSHSLRFSYGSEKGREREEWQNEVLDLGVPMFIRSVERYGFSAVLINKKAYLDGGASLLHDFNASGRSAVLADSDDLVCLSLQPDSHPSLPPYFDPNWYGMEGTAEEHWRWSRGEANILLFNNGREAKQIAIRFGLASIQARRVEVYDGSELICSVDLSAGRLVQSLITASAVLRPGHTTLRFHTDTPAALAGNGDPRPFAFRVTNFDTVQLR